MGADLGVPLSDLRPLCVSVAGGESRKTFTQFSKREKREKREIKIRTRRDLIKTSHNQKSQLDVPVCLTHL